jgi:hypothetical protein
MSAFIHLGGWKSDQPGARVVNSVKKSFECMKGKKKKLKGFSLGEVVLSVALLTVGILPVMSAMTDGLKFSLESRDSVTASGLAQEGTELVKNVKDNNVLAGNASLSAWLPSSGSSWNDCRIDIGDSVLAPGNKISCGHGASSFRLYLSSGQFRHVTATETKFFRKIFLLNYGGAGNERVMCLSVVYWGSYTPGTDRADVVSNCNMRNKCVYAESVLTPWGS